MNTYLKFALKLSAILCFFGAVFAFSMAAFVEGIEPKGGVEQRVWAMPDMSIAFTNGETCDVAPVRAIDGDTFQAATTTTISPTLDITEITGFRLLGVDTPERGEEGYQEAKDYLRKRIVGKLIHVRLKQGPGKKRDSFS
jgi:endonuclease YncB( thermonuclease family)